MKKTIPALLVAALLFSLCACSQNQQSVMSIKPVAFSAETMEVLDLFDDEIQFFDISLDDTVKSYSISLWVYRDGQWNEDGRIQGDKDSSAQRIAIRLTENSFELYNVYEDGHEKCSYPVLDNLFEESIGIGGTRIDQETPIVLNEEIPVWVKIGTSTDRLDVSKNFREIECNAGIAVTFTASDEMLA